MACFGPQPVWLLWDYLRIDRRSPLTAKLRVIRVIRG